MLRQSGDFLSRVGHTEQNRSSISILQELEAQLGSQATIGNVIGI